MGITGLIPFLEKASRRVNVDEFSGCTVAIDSYCWLHKGAFACADKLVRGEETDVYIRYCLKYVTMLLAKNIKPILVFDGRHLPAKAQTESKRRESRQISKKRAAELLSLGKIEEAKSFMRRSVDVTHSMALSLIKECRKRNVDCIVAPYEADAQLAYLNIKNIAHLVITEDSDLILFGCNKVLFKMDLDGVGTLVETVKLPLVMKCPIEHYTFDKFRQMCIMSGCDYLPSLPGIGLAKARQFITATQDPNIANCLRKLPSYFNKASLTVTDEYRENFLKAEATFKHQYVYDPIERKMLRLTEPDDEDIETALCVNAGELLDDKTAFQLALGNIDPFTLKKMDDWHPDDRNQKDSKKTDSWKEVAKHPTIWSKDFSAHLAERTPWLQKVNKLPPVFAAPRTSVRKIVNMAPKYVAETQDQDESLTIESLSSMYCIEPATKKAKTDCDNGDNNNYEAFSQNRHNIALSDTEIVKEIDKQKERSPILENKLRSFKKCLKNGNIMKRLSKFTRTVLDENNVVESKFFSIDLTDEKATSRNSITIEEPLNKTEKMSRNPFKVKTVEDINSQSELNKAMLESQCAEIMDSQLSNSQKENCDINSSILETKNPFKLGFNNRSDEAMSEDYIENTYPLEVIITPVDSQISFGASQLDSRPASPIISLKTFTYNPSSPKYKSSSPIYNPTSPSYKSSSPTYKSSSPIYNPTSPSYKPSSPTYVPSSPTYKSSSPAYKPSSPSYAPSSPIYVPSSPTYKSKSPIYSPSSPTYYPNTSSYKPSSPTYKPSSPTYYSNTPSYKPSSPTYKPSSPTYKPSRSTHKLSSPTYKPSSPTYKPSRSTHKPSSPTYKPSSPTYKPSRSTHKPSSPTYKPSSPTYKPSRSTHKPSSPTYKPSSPTYKPSRSTHKPSSPTYKPSSPTYKPSRSTHKLSSPTYKPSSPTYKPSRSTHKPSSPTYKPSSPTYKPSRSTHKPSSPTYKPSSPTYKPSRSTHKPSSPTYKPSSPTYKPSRSTHKLSSPIIKHTPASQPLKKAGCRAPGLKRTASLPSNQSLLSKFGFQKKAILKK